MPFASEYGIELRFRDSTEDIETRGGRAWKGSERSVERNTLARQSLSTDRRTDR